MVLSESADLDILEWLKSWADAEGAPIHELVSVALLHSCFMFVFFYFVCFTQDTHF